MFAVVASGIPTISDDREPRQRSRRSRAHRLYPSQYAPTVYELNEQQLRLRVALVVDRRQDHERSDDDDVHRERERGAVRRTAGRARQREEDARTRWDRCTDASSSPLP